MESNYTVKAYEHNQVTLYAVRGESDSRTMIFDIIEKSGVVSAFSNAAVTDKMLDLSAFSEINLLVYNSLISSVTGAADAEHTGRVSFVLSGECSSETGLFDCEIELSGSNRVLRIVGIKLQIASASENNDIEVLAGEDAVLTVNVMNINGTPHSLAAGDVISFGIRRTVDDSDYVIYITQTIDANTGNTCDITIDGASTASLKGDFVYGVSLGSNGEFYTIIPEAGFSIRRSVIRRRTS